jgi:hypothetical protein
MPINPTAPSPQVPMLPMDARLQARESIKRKIKAIELLKLERVQYEKQIADYDQQKDAAADEHTATAEPLQDQLKADEQLVLGMLVKGELVPEEIEQRRAETMSAIAAANEKLSDATTRLERLKELPRKKIKELVDQIVDATTLPNKLITRPLANDVWFLEHFGTRTAMELISNCSVDVRRDVEKWTALAERFRAEKNHNADDIQFRAERASAVLQALGGASEAAQRTEIARVQRRPHVYEDWRHGSGSRRRNPGRIRSRYQGRERRAGIAQQVHQRIRFAGRAGQQVRR